MGTIHRPLWQMLPSLPLPLLAAALGETHVTAICLLLQPLYGFGGKDPARFARAAGHQDLLYMHDPELTFEQVCLCSSLAQTSKSYSGAAGRCSDGTLTQAIVVIVAGNSL